MNFNDISSAIREVIPDAEVEVKGEDRYAVIAVLCNDYDDKKMIKLVYRALSDYGILTQLNTCHITIKPSQSRLALDDARRRASDAAYAAAWNRTVQTGDDNDDDDDGSPDNPNWPSTTGNPSGGGRGNNPSR